MFKINSMEIKYTKSYDRTYKKIKKHTSEAEILERIKQLIENTENFEKLVNNPLAKMYGFERLKYEFNEYYSFNLSKNGSVIRLIIFPKNEYQIYMIFISYKHYKDFNKERVIFYDE